MDLHHVVMSLSQLWSFNHAKCDAILQNRHIEIANAYNPNKSGWERNSVYLGFFWITGWLALCSAALVRSWRNDTDAKPQRAILPFFLLFGLALLYVQLQGMARYVDVCRRSLALQPVSKYNGMESPWTFAFMILTFAGAWYAILGHRYRTAKSSSERVVSVVMMVVGGIFFIVVGAAALLQQWG